MTCGAPSAEPVVSVASLRAAGRALPPVFVLRLSIVAAPGASATTEHVRCREVLRLLPGRRLVARVEVGGAVRLLKLFFGPGARRYCRREARGCERLMAAGVATPALLGRVTDGAEGYGLLFEFLEHAVPVDAADAVALARCAAELGRLHAAGCWHGDLHLENFLLQRDGGRGLRVALVDGDGIRATATGRPLGRARGLDNLGVLCAQRPPLQDVHLDALYDAYAAARGWSVPDPSGAEALARATRRQRRERVRRYLEKTQRDCSEYACERSWTRYFVCVRSALTDALRDFADHPERAFASADVRKAGNSATVIRTHLGDTRCIVKRYNVKGPMHRLRRVLKPQTRFRLSWCNGQRLRFLDIPTARPLALVEQRFGPVRGVAYLVMEDLGDRDLLSEVAEHGLAEAHLAAVVRLFQALEAAQLTHGDAKATNFLIRGEEVALIDLDAMREGPGLDKDARRFCANWSDRPEVHARVRAALEGIGLV